MRIRRTISVFAAATAVVALSGAGTPSHHGVTLYVSPHGSDRAAGTAAHPLKTPQAAVDRLGPAGGAVQLADGRYARQRIRLTGRSHIAVRAAAGATPVLDGAGLAVPDGQNAMVEIRDSADITVSGLTITGYRTKALDAVPIGILVKGSGTTFQDLRDCWRGWSLAPA